METGNRKDPESIEAETGGKQVTSTTNEEGFSAVTAAGVLAADISMERSSPRDEYSSLDYRTIQKMKAEIIENLGDEIEDMILRSRINTSSTTRNTPTAATSTSSAMENFEDDGFEKVRRHLNILKKEVNLG